MENESFHQQLENQAVAEGVRMVTAAINDLYIVEVGFSMIDRPFCREIAKSIAGFRKVITDLALDEADRLDLR